jgi:phosphoribosylformylglycinamidine synthase
MMDRAHPTSASVDLSAWSDLPLRALLFGEAQGRVIVSTADAKAVHAAAAAHGVRATTIGTVAMAAAPFSITVGSRRIQSSVVPLADAYHEAIPRIMSRAASAQDVALVSDAQV